MQKTGTHKRILYAVYVYRPFCMCRQCQEPVSYLLCQSLFFCEMIFADFISFFINSGIAELPFWSDSGVSGCASTVCEFTLIGSTRGLLINVLLAEGFTTVIPRMDFLLRNSLSSSGVRSGAASTRLPSPKRSISKLLSFSSCSSSVSSSSASVIIGSAWMEVSVSSSANALSRSGSYSSANALSRSGSYFSSDSVSPNSESESTYSSGFSKM